MERKNAASGCLFSNAVQIAICIQCTCYCHAEAHASDKMSTSKQNRDPPRTPTAQFRATFHLSQSTFLCYVDASRYNKHCSRPIYVAYASNDKFVAVPRKRVWP